MHRSGCIGELNGCIENKNGCIGELNGCMREKMDD